MRSALLRWYRLNRRDLPWRRTRDPYAIWVAEVMLQQTQVATVVPYFSRFLETFPGVTDLAEAPEEKVLATWSGLGYYRRARALSAGARAIVARHGGRIPSEPSELLAIPGIGRYTAGAIASIAFGRAEPILDGNVRRLLSRLHARRGLGAAEERALWRTAGELVGGAHPGEINQAMMEVGAVVCTPRAPRCGRCPVARFCLARESGRPESFPERRPSRRPERVRVALAVVKHRERILLERTGAGSPLRGTWDLPAVEVPAGAEAREALRRAISRRHGIATRLEEEAARETHAIVNRRLALEVFEGIPERGTRSTSSRVRWVVADGLSGVAVSGATRKALRAAALARSERQGLDQNRSQGGTQSSLPRPGATGGSGSGSSGRSKR